MLLLLVVDALFYALRELDKVKVKGDDQKAGVDIIKKALQAPIRQIAANTGVDSSVVVGKLLEGKKATQGFDAQEEQYCDMFSKGIIDPMKVVRSALQDASSIAGLLITTEAMIADKPEEKDYGPAMPPGGMGGIWVEWECNSNHFKEFKKGCNFAAFFFEYNTQACDFKLNRLLKF